MKTSRCLAAFLLTAALSTPLMAESMIQGISMYPYLSKPRPREAAATKAALALIPRAKLPEVLCAKFSSLFDERRVEQTTISEFSECIAAHLSLLEIESEQGATDAKLAVAGTRVEVAIQGLTDLAGEDAVNRTLIRRRYEFRNYKHWVNHYKRHINSADATEEERADFASVAQQYTDLNRVVDSKLAKRGLFEMMAGQLVTGPVIGTVGDSAGTQDAAGGADTNVMARIVWETRHFGDGAGGFADGSFFGSFGFQPALTLVKEESSTDESEEDDADAPSEAPAAKYQEAFAWDAGAKLNLRINDLSEFSLFGRGGQIRLISQVSVLDRKERSTLVVPIDNGTDETEFFWEGGASWSLFNNPIEVIHAEASTSDPLLNLGVSYRRDNRFRKAGELVSFSAPANRLVYRFMINGLKVIDRRDLAEKQGPFTVSFGVEHERGLPGPNRVPAATKFIIRSEINLLKALRSGS